MDIKDGGSCDHSVSPYVQIPLFVTLLDLGFVETDGKTNLDLDLTIKIIRLMASLPTSIVDNPV